MMAQFLMQAIAGAARRRAAAGGGDEGWLFADNLDYTDNTAANTAGKFGTIGSGVAFGYNTSPAPIAPEASTSLRLTTGHVTTNPFAAQSTLWVYVKINTSNAAIPITILYLKDEANATIGSVSMLSTAALRINAGGATNATSGASAIPNGISCHLWVKYSTNGSTATIDLYQSQGGPRGTRLLTQTGTSTTNAVAVGLGAGASSTIFLLNKLRISAFEIGDNPA
jgi:hypothetical protein